MHDLGNAQPFVSRRVVGIATAVATILLLAFALISGNWSGKPIVRLGPGEKESFRVGATPIQVVVPTTRPFWIQSPQGDLKIRLPNGDEYSMTKDGRWFKGGQRVCQNPGESCMGMMTDEGFSLRSASDKTIPVTVQVQ